jgi:hypothetical protein
VRAVSPADPEVIARSRNMKIRLIAVRLETDFQKLAAQEIRILRHKSEHYAFERQFLNILF